MRILGRQIVHGQDCAQALMRGEHGILIELMSLGFLGELGSEVLRIVHHCGGLVVVELGEAFTGFVMGNVPIKLQLIHFELDPHVGLTSMVHGFAECVPTRLHLLWLFERLSRHQILRSRRYLRLFSRKDTWPRLHS